MVLTRTLGARKARDIKARINHRLDLWERIIHACLVGGALVEGRSKEGYVKRHEEEE